MIKLKKSLSKVLLLSILLFLLPGFFLKNYSFAQSVKRVRVAIVYNDSQTGKRYRDGIRDVIDTNRVTVIEEPYLKALHGVNLIKELIESDSVDIILGPTESEVFTRVYNIDGIGKTGVSVISGLATTIIGNDKQGYFFRLNLDANSRVFEVWSYMNKYWISKIAVIYEDTEFGRNAEAAFKDLMRYSDSKQDYTSIPFVSPHMPVHDLKKLLQARPEVIGLFCEREELENLCRYIKLLNNTGVPYDPYFFTLIDITQAGKALDNFYFPSLKNYGESVLIDSIGENDEVFILGQETGLLLNEALAACSTENLRKQSGRLQFQNQIVRILRGESSGNMKMNFNKMKNLGPIYLYRLKDDIVLKIAQEEDIHWFTMIIDKIVLIYSIHNYKLILNLLIIFIITFSISRIEIRRSFPKKHVKIFSTWVFYYFFFIHLMLVLFLYIYLAINGNINYSDTLMTIIISLTPSALFKTTFLETRSGQNFGLEEYYKRMMASIDEKIMKSRYEKLVGLENIIAYSNSEESMRRALLRVYRNNPSKIQAAKLIQKLEEELGFEIDYMNRKRTAARLIMRQFDQDQLKAEGFVPSNWNYNAGVDPSILIRFAAKYCTEDKERRKHILGLLDSELKDLEERNKERYNEIISVHEKELSITMSKEGELLVKLRLLMVLHGFNIEWLKTENIITEDHLKQAKEGAKNRAKHKSSLSIFFSKIILLFKKR